MRREKGKEKFCLEIRARSSGAEEEEEEAGPADVPLVAVLVKTR